MELDQRDDRALYQPPSVHLSDAATNYAYELDQQKPGRRPYAYELDKLGAKRADIGRHVEHLLRRPRWPVARPTFFRARSYYELQELFYSL